MVIAYGIALSLDWDRPKWAGFAVAMISLNNVGQSLNKGAMRMLGTIVAGSMAFLFIALFPQQRWIFMVLLSGYVAICTYLMGGKKHQYFYNVCGFVCVIICLNGGANATTTFQTAMARLQETGMGILVYSCVNILIWPQKSSKELHESAAKLVDLYGRMFNVYFNLMTGKAVEDSTQTARVEESRTLDTFSVVLLSAKADSYEVWESRRHWSIVERQLYNLSDIFERWRDSVSDAVTLELPKLMPNINDFYLELNERFSRIGKMLNGKESGRSLRKISLHLDKKELAKLSHFEKATLALIRKHLVTIERIVDSLFESVQTITCDSSILSDTKPVTTKKNAFSFDPDRFVAVTRVLITMWLAYILWIWVRVPGGTSFVIMATCFAMAVSPTPFIPIPALLKPIIIGCAFASFLYIFIMPSLSSFLGLSVMIFVGFFCICYFLRKPEQMLGKLLCMVLFLSLTSLQNEQTYNFLVVVNTSLMFILIIGLLSITAHLPTTAYPEKAFINLLRRFFRNAEFQLSQLSEDRYKRKGISRFLKMILYSEDLLGLTKKMQTWSKMIDHKLFSDIQSQKIQDILDGLRDLAFRIRQMIDAGNLPQAELLKHELMEDVDFWNLAIQRIFQQWEINPGIQPRENLQKKLTNKIIKMEKRMDEILELKTNEELTNQDYENFYNLIGCSRGLSKSVIAYASAVGGVNWRQLREARF